MNINILFVVLGVFFIWFIYTYNSFISLRNYVRKSFSGIDIQLKRRTDLIPNLVSSVKGYASHEKRIMEEVAKVRSELIRARESEDVKEMAVKDNELERVLKSLFAVSENYPKLKANKNFLELQKELRRAEDQVAASRRIYNSNVTLFNNKVELFPSNLVARLFGFTKKEWFTARPVDKKNVKARF